MVNNVSQADLSLLFVLSDKCLVGLSEADTTARAILQGKKLKIIAATLQTTPLAVMSLASKPISTPHMGTGGTAAILLWSTAVDRRS